VDGHSGGLQREGDVVFRDYGLEQFTDLIIQPSEDRTQIQVVVGREIGGLNPLREGAECAAQFDLGGDDAVCALDAPRRRGLGRLRLPPG
jgi:hypothetical protein